MKKSSTLEGILDEIRRSKGTGRGSSQDGRKWLGSSPFISHEVRPFGRGPTLPYLRDLLTMGQLATYKFDLGWSSKYIGVLRCLVVGVGYNESRAPGVWEAENQLIFAVLHLTIYGLHSFCASFFDILEATLSKSSVGREVLPVE